MINVNLTGIRACVFDAYGTLFDVNSAAQRTQDALRDKWQQFAEFGEQNNYSTPGCVA